ncbi:hypothetical protein SuUB63_19880 [Streptococcus uberis]
MDALLRLTEAAFDTNLFIVEVEASFLGLPGPLREEEVLCCELVLLDEFSMRRLE